VKSNNFAAGTLQA